MVIDEFFNWTDYKHLTGNKNLQQLIWKKI